MQNIQRQLVILSKTAVVTVVSSVIVSVCALLDLQAAVLVVVA